MEPVDANAMFVVPFFPTPSSSPSPLFVLFSSTNPAPFLPHLPILSPPLSPPVHLLGEHLRICPQGYTCCTSDMEDNLAMLSRREMEALLKDAGRSLQTSLNGQYKAFDGEFVYSC